MFNHTRLVIEGPSFKYSNEYRANGVGFPLREVHCFKVGKTEIEIQNVFHLESFLSEYDVAHVKTTLQGQTVFALRGNNGKMVLFQFDSEKRMTIRHLGPLAFRKTVKESFDAERIRLNDAHKARLAEKQKEYSQVIGLIAK